MSEFELDLPFVPPATAPPRRKLHTVAADPMHTIWVLFTDDSWIWADCASWWETHARATDDVRAVRVSADQEYIVWDSGATLSLRTLEQRNATDTEGLVVLATGVDLIHWYRPLAAQRMVPADSSSFTPVRDVQTRLGLGDGAFSDLARHYMVDAIAVAWRVLDLLNAIAARHGPDAPRALLTTPWLPALNAHRPDERTPLDTIAAGGLDYVEAHLSGRHAAPVQPVARSRYRLELSAQVMAVLRDRPHHPCPRAGALIGDILLDGQLLYATDACYGSADHGSLLHDQWVLGLLTGLRRATSRDLKLLGYWVGLPRGMTTLPSDVLDQLRTHRSALIPRGAHLLIVTGDHEKPVLDAQPLHNGGHQRTRVITPVSRRQRV